MTLVTQSAPTTHHQSQECAAVQPQAKQMDTRVLVVGEVLIDVVRTGTDR